MAYAICHTFSHEVGRVYFLELCKLDGEKYNEMECLKMLKYAYGKPEQKITFKTIIFYASMVGYRKKEIEKKA